MKVGFAGYRDWSLKIYNRLRLQKRFAYQDELLWSVKDLFLDPKQITVDSTKGKGIELMLFVGWSAIVPQAVIKAVPCICLHPSPLPKYRGGSPLQHQIMAGETESAVTLFIMNESLDNGPIISQSPLLLEGELDDIFDRIVETGSRDIIELLESTSRGIAPKLREQDEKEATVYKRRKPEQSEIKAEWFKKCSAEDVHNKVRALQAPYPEPFIECRGGSKLYLLKTRAEKGG